MTRRVLCLLLFGAAAFGSVVRVEVTVRSDLLGGKPFGAAGPYEMVAGKVYFEVDPKISANRIIADIDLAPVNARGKVEFSADLFKLEPRDAAAGNGIALLEICNRGRKTILATFNQAETSLNPSTPADFGDGLLLKRGFTLVWLGWQHDVPRDKDLMRIYAPVARRNGKPVTGLVRSQYVPTGRVLSFSLGDRTMIAYPVLDPGDPLNELTVRDRVTDPRDVIPRKQWQFGRDEEGKPVPDRTRVFMASGFQPGRIYEVVYTAQDPVVVGLGPAAIRDLVSFLKHGRASSLAGRPRNIKHAIAFGVSQSGRFLRSFLYDGFNADEHNRRVFDGVWAHVAGAGRGSFNHRFAQPSRDGHPFMNVLYPTDIFPFTDTAQRDPPSGITDGLLLKAEHAGVVPKTFYTNSSYEYWGRVASLIHTTIDGKSDVGPARNTRIYLIAGTQHVPAAFPPKRIGTRNAPNPNDFRWPLRALLVAMERWVGEDLKPPASRYPRISGGTLVPLGKVSFPKISGIDFPTRPKLAYRLDFGPEFRTKGIADTQPPTVGAPFPVLLPQVDKSGNETSGIRLPDLRAPLATYTGWNLRDPRLGAPAELYSMTGSFLPFAATAAAAGSDPRPSIRARYRGKREYLARFEAEAKSLAREGFLLERDLPAIVRHAGAVWDHVAGTE